MAIQWKGKLVDEKQLETIDISKYTKIKQSPIDYVLTALILVYPMICGIQLLICRYNGQLINVLIGDLIGFFIVIILMICHEVLHAITFSKNEKVSIWYQGFTMMTYCTEEKTPMRMIYTLLLPHLLITLPLIIFNIVFSLFVTPSLYMKIYGLISLIMITGSFSDLSQALMIIRNKRKIHTIKLNGHHFYYQ